MFLSASNLSWSSAHENPGLILKFFLLFDAVWYGAFTGIGIAILLGIAFIITFYVAAKSVFQGEGKMIFTGFIQLLAAFLITVLAFAMLKFMNYEQKWERKLYQAATEKVNICR